MRIIDRLSPKRQSAASRPEIELRMRLDLAISYYNAARAEMTQRVSHRDTILAFFLGGSATIIGIAVGSARLAPLLFIVPIFGMGASLVYSHHTRMVAALGKYLSIELQSKLTELEEGLGTIRHWDNSLTLAHLRAPYLFRIVTVFAIITVPQVAALVLGSSLVGQADLRTYGIWVSVASIMISLAIQLVVEVANRRHFQLLRKLGREGGGAQPNIV